MKEIRFGIIGAGNIAREHLGSMYSAKGVKCVGVCDKVYERAVDMVKDYPDQYRVYKDAQEMVESPDIDAVILAVPNYQHNPMFLLAAKNGKHVLCEKPMALNVKQCEEMIEAAEKYGIKGQMGFCTRFMREIEAMKDHIDAGNIGEAYFGQIDTLRSRGAPTGWFGNNEKSGGGPLIDMGVHYIDATWYLMGCPKPVSVKALNYHKIENRYPKSEGIYAAYEQDTVYNAEDSSHGLITFENGKGIMYQASWSINVPRDGIAHMDIYGTKGGLRRHPLKFIREEESGMTETNLHYLDKDCFTLQHEAFGRVIRGEEESRAPLSQGAVMQRMLEGLYESARTGKEVIL